MRASRTPAGSSASCRDRCLVSAGAHRDDGTSCQPHDALGHAAHHHAIHPSPSVRATDDHVDVVSDGIVQNLVSRVPDRGGDDDTTLGEDPSRRESSSARSLIHRIHGLIASGGFHAPEGKIIGCRIRIHDHDRLRDGARHDGDGDTHARHREHNEQLLQRRIETGARTRRTF
jgi:hypothetical protein